MNLIYFKRRIYNYLYYILVTLSMIIGLFWLGWILLTLFQQGLSSINLDIFTKITQSPGSNGGLLNAILGSFLLVFLAILFGTPIGILAGTYLTEYGNDNLLTKIVRFVNDILLSTPSILIGLFIYQIYVTSVHHFSGWAGAFALTLIAVPIIMRTTEDMFLLVPNYLREAAAALGAPKWKVIVLIVFRVAKTGIITGILLALARISGETAPLLFTALNNQFMSLDLNQPMANLPSVIFQYSMSPYQDWHQLAWAGALLITLWVLSLNIIVRATFKATVLH